MANSTSIGEHTLTDDKRCQQAQSRCCGAEALSERQGTPLSKNKNNKKQKHKTSEIQKKKQKLKNVNCKYTLINNYIIKATQRQTKYLSDKHNRRSIGLECWRACVVVRISASVCKSIFSMCFLRCFAISHLRFVFSFYLYIYVYMYLLHLCYKATPQITLIVAR